MNLSAKSASSAGGLLLWYVSHGGIYNIRYIKY